MEGKRDMIFVTGVPAIQPSVVVPCEHVGVWQWGEEMGLVGHEGGGKV